ncbi:LOW PSII ACCUMULATION protein [Perilla frutescens var. hirtella]|uniref:LOW PSII ACCUMULATION protein n=1 Tax=Perilla frutescens var. hirtella TaxID=608512 RepID=A0AAD4P497_PERFH|nr:LOW PSII ACCUMULATION protein [Perilla frutescens var. hirtella]
MPLLTSLTVSWFPIPFTSPPKPQVLSYRGFGIEKQSNICCLRSIGRGSSRNLDFHGGAAAAAAGESGYSREFDIPFPSDYDELLKQAKEATELALKNNKQLMEIEFPTSGLDSVPGDGEGGIEMTGSLQLIREFCDLVVSPEKATRTRVFLPEANEVAFARKSAFGGSSLKLDYLTKPSFFQDFGFVSKVKMADRVKPADELFLVGYPYFNVNEMLVVEELYKEAVVNTSRKLIIFNGELDRIRSGYYPAFFYPKLAALTDSLFPKMETVYYIHNFKGRNGGVLFRCYPGPWKVLRKVRKGYICVHQQEVMPSLKEVALEILPKA